MNIHLTKDGKETITGTEYERRCLRVSAMVMEAYGKHCVSSEGLDGAAAKCLDMAMVLTPIKILTPEEPEKTK